MKLRNTCRICTGDFNASLGTNSTSLKAHVDALNLNLLLSSHDEISCRSRSLRGTWYQCTEMFDDARATTTTFLHLPFSSPCLHKISPFTKFGSYMLSMLLFRHKLFGHLARAMNGSLGRFFALFVLTSSEVLGAIAAGASGRRRVKSKRSLAYTPMRLAPFPDFVVVAAAHASSSSSSSVDDAAHSTTAQPQLAPHRFYGEEAEGKSILVNTAC